MSQWVRFADIKAVVSLGPVLRWYGVEGLQRSGADQYHGRCPIHGGQGRDAFQVNMARNLFHCFACGAGGNVLDFVAAMEHCSVREAALRLRQRYGEAGPGTDWQKARSPAPTRAKLVRKKRNPPLRFSLNVDGSHPYLAERRLEPSTATYFGVGFYGGPGLMSGRIAIPIHDPAGRLVAYAGRTVDPAREPRYQFPAGFQKSETLFNYHHARQSGAGCVVVVEGFFDCMHVHQAGFPNVVALMGSLLSETQRELLIGFPRVLLLLDGDVTGRRASERIAAAVGPGGPVTQVLLDPGLQPDQMTATQIRRMLVEAERRLPIDAN